MKKTFLKMLYSPVPYAVICIVCLLLTIRLHNQPVERQILPTQTVIISDTTLQNKLQEGLGVVYDIQGLAHRNEGNIENLTREIEQLKARLGVND